VLGFNLHMTFAIDPEAEAVQHVGAHGGRLATLTRRISLLGEMKRVWRRTSSSLGWARDNRPVQLQRLTGRLDAFDARGEGWYR
jgi:hypothetical protein